MWRKQYRRYDLTRSQKGAYAPIAELDTTDVKAIRKVILNDGSDFALLSFGIRLFGENLTADLGFIHPTGWKTDGFPFVPWLGFTYNFGGR